MPEITQVPTPIDPDAMDEIQLRSVVKNMLVNCGAYLMIAKLDDNEVIGLVFSDADNEEIHVPRKANTFQGDNIIH